MPNKPGTGGAELMAENGELEMNNPFFYNLIQEICSEMDIKSEKMSYDWVIQLSKNGKISHIARNYFDLNSQVSGLIADDKYATYEVLKSQNVPVIEHEMVFNPNVKRNLVFTNNILEIIETEFSKYRALVVKPNNSFQGNGVTLCNTVRDVELALEKIFENNENATICPYYNIKTEYRTFYLNGEVLLIYGKTKPCVIGDGSKSLEELIKKLNLPEKDVVQDSLRALDMNYIPSNNEKVEISWKHNLSGGAKPHILQKGDLYNKIQDLAIKAGKAMNINFATIDIIQTVENELYVLEVNSGVCATIFAESVDGRI